jgi:colicin import membrane protein
MRKKEIPVISSKADEGLDKIISVIRIIEGHVAEMRTEIKKLKVKAPKASKTSKIEVEAAPKKRGRPAKVKTEAVKVFKVKAEAAPKKAKRVKDGNKPSIKDAILRVLGSTPMTAAQILTALEKRDWVPGASNPKAYIVTTLCSSLKGHVERVDRGLYRASGSPVISEKAPKKVKVKPEAKVSIKAKPEVKAETKTEAPKKRGRPAKVKTEAELSAAPKKRGRPAKVKTEAAPKVEAVGAVAPKKRGRPAKVNVAPKVEAPVQANKGNGEVKVDVLLAHGITPETGAPNPFAD